MKFRKKPVVIEAMQFNGAWTGDGTDLLEWLGRGGDWSAEDSELKIHTPEGTLVASKGDWIIKGIAGEFYPCKPDIFAATYDAEPADTGLPPHQQRVISESEELRARLTSLENFFEGAIFAGLPSPEQARLRTQATYMAGYRDVLSQRIAAF